MNDILTSKNIHEVGTPRRDVISWQNMQKNTSSMRELLFDKGAEESGDI